MIVCRMLIKLKQIISVNIQNYKTAWLLQLIHSLQVFRRLLGKIFKCEEAHNHAVDKWKYAFTYIGLLSDDKKY